MIDFDIRWIFPRFLINDQEGFAMCKALEAGLRDYLDIIQGAVDVWGNVSAMPEWRLDELAWEYNCPYDYFASVDKKRKWIAEAYELARLQGTPAAIVKYLEGYFDGVDVQSADHYQADPYHFRVVVAGEQTAESSAWAQKAIATVKNVRSLLDSVTYNGGTSSANHYTHAGIAGISIDITSVTL